MKNCLQTGCLFLGILCFFYYLAIVLYAGFRTSISWIWLLGGALFLFLWRALFYQAQHPGSPIRFVTGALGVLILAGVLIVLVLGSRIVGAMTEKPSADLDYVVVLGAQVKGEVPSKALYKRLTRALEYAKANENTKLILSGGQGNGEDITEAECMRRWLADQGVLENRMILEERSTNTRENLEFSDGLTGCGGKRTGILSNDFHVYRAVRLAKKLGYGQAEGIAAPSDPIMQVHYVVREVFALGKEKLVGNI